MKYVVAYDIQDDRIREKVAKLCEGFGHRVQGSVFEADLERDAIDVLTARLQRELERPENGDIRVYRVCHDCLRSSFRLGTGRDPSEGDAYVVV